MRYFAAPAPDDKNPDLPTGEVGGPELENPDEELEEDDVDDGEEEDEDGDEDDDESSDV